MSRMFDFKVLHSTGAARRGQMRTAHGIVETPAFMPVGTGGAVKSVTQRNLQELGAQMLMANTYHLYLRPGAELIARRGGLHRYMAWDRPIMTDSGGYQVFSLASRRTINDDGATFRSHIDGRECHLTPEDVATIQWRLGSDIAMVFDECEAYPSSVEATRRAMERTLRWASRARNRFVSLQANMADQPDVLSPNPEQAQFGIIQGGIYKELRASSVQHTVSLGFDAYAIGGLSVGEPYDLMYDVVAETAPQLPHDRPRYLMGAGMPDDLVEAAARGIDLFDCVLPTRNARNGQLFTSTGRLNIKQARYKEDDRPIDETCQCQVCSHHSRAYLRHLFVTREMTAATLNTLHNLHFYLDTMRRIREAIVFGSLEELRQEFRLIYPRTPGRESQEAMS